MGNININISGASEDIFLQAVLKALEVGSSEIVRLKTFLATKEESIQECNRLLMATQSENNQLNDAHERCMQSLNIKEQELSRVQEEARNNYELLEKKYIQEQSEHEATKLERNTLVSEKEAVEKVNTTLIGENAQLENDKSRGEERINVLEKGLMSLLNDVCKDIVASLNKILANSNNEKLNSYICKIIRLDNDSEIRGFSQFCEITDLKALYRNISLDNTPFSALASMFLWRSNEALAEQLGNKDEWEQIYNNYSKFESILSILGIAVDFPKTMSTEDPWFLNNTCDYVAEKVHEFEAIFGHDIKIPRSSPIVIMRISSKYMEKSKKGICFLGN